MCVSGRARLGRYGDDVAIESIVGLRPCIIAMATPWPDSATVNFAVRPVILAQYREGAAPPPLTLSRLLLTPYSAASGSGSRLCSSTRLARREAIRSSRSTAGKNPPQRKRKRVGCFPERAKPSKRRCRAVLARQTCGWPGQGAGLIDLCNAATGPNPRDVVLPAVLGRERPRVHPAATRSKSGTPRSWTRIREPP